MSGQNQAVKEEILNRIDIVELVAEHVVLKKSGSNFTGLCPFHPDKNPSLSVSPEKQIFRCFSCGVGGDVFTFYMKIKHVDYREALKTLAKRAGVELPDYQQQPLTDEQQKKQELKDSLREIYQKAMSFYQWYLNHQKYGEIPRAYLQERQVNHDMLSKFALGFAPNSWDALFRYLQQGFQLEAIKESGLVKPRKNEDGYYDVFRNRLMFPIFNERDEVIAFGGRTFEDNQAKYINSPETSIYTKGEHLYALNFAKNKIREKNQILLVEGYLDVITCHQYGFENCVAALGTALTPDQARKLLRYSRNILLAYDADQAGQKAAERGSDVIRELTHSSDVKLNILKVPSGKDPDAYLHGEGAAKFQELIEAAQPIFDFQIEAALNEYNLETPEGKTQALDKCLPVIAKIKNKIYKDEMIKRVANWPGLEVREEDIRRKLKFIEYSFRKNKQAANQDSSKYQRFQNYQKKPFDKNKMYLSESKKMFSQELMADYEKVPGALQAEKGIIYFMVERYRAIDYIIRKLEHIEFQDRLNEKIKNFICTLNEQKIKPTWKLLLNELNESEEQQRIVEIWETLDETDISVDKILRDYLRMVKLNYLKNQREETKKDIDEARARGDHEIIRNLMEIFSDLHKKIKLLEKEVFQTEEVD